MLVRILIVCATLFVEWCIVRGDNCGKSQSGRNKFKIYTSTSLQRGRRLRTDASAAKLVPLSSGCKLSPKYDGGYETSPPSLWPLVSDEVFSSELVYRSFYACQQESPANTRKLHIGSFQSEFFLLNSYSRYFTKDFLRRYKWTISNFSYSVESSDRGIKHSCIRISRSQEKHKLVALAYLKHTLHELRTKMKHLKQTELDNKTTLDSFRYKKGLQNIGFRLQQEADRLGIIEMHPVETKFSQSTKQYYATNYDDFPVYYSCPRLFFSSGGLQDLFVRQYFNSNYNGLGEIILVQNTCQDPIEIQITLKPKETSSTPICSKAQYYEGLNVILIVFIFSMVITYISFAVMMDIGARSPIFAKYRDAIQALGPPTLFYGGCEGRSFVYPTLLTVASLMWINLFFYAPQKAASGVSLGMFFRFFTLQLQDTVALSESSAVNSMVFKSLFQVVGVIITACGIVPLQYAALLPNYEFPSHWFARAGVQPTMSSRAPRGWFRCKLGLVTIGAVALLIYTTILSIQFYSYLGDPIMVRDTWQLAKEIWLYYIHMAICFLLILYFVVLFGLPQSGKGKWAKVREWVLRKLERREQLKLLLESEFMDSIDLEERRQAIQKDGRPQGALNSTQVPDASFQGQQIQSQSLFHPKSKLLGLQPTARLSGAHTVTAASDQSQQREDSFQNIILVPKSNSMKLKTNISLQDDYRTDLSPNASLHRENIFSDSSQSRESMPIDLQPSSSFQVAPRTAILSDKLQHSDYVLSSSYLVPKQKLLQRSSTLPQTRYYSGSAGNAAGNLEIKQVNNRAYGKPLQPSSTTNLVQNAFQAPSEVLSQRQTEAGFRYSTWVTSTVIVTLHLLFFAFLTQVQFHAETYNCLKSSSSNNLEFQELSRNLTSCLPAQLASLADNQWLMTSNQITKNANHIRSALNQFKNIDISNANVALGALDDMEGFYSDVQPSMEAAKLNPLNPMHLFVWLLIRDKRDQVQEAISQCTDAYRAAFSISYSAGLIFGVYAVLRVMHQYKAVSLVRLKPRFQLRNRLMQAVEERVGGNKKIVRDMQDEIGNIMSFHGVVESSLFAAVQVSTSYLSLIFLGYLGTASLSALFCGYFWRNVVLHQLPKISLFLAIIFLDVIMNALASRCTRRGQKEVANPGWWLFYFFFLTSINMALGQLLAVFRIIQLVSLSIFDISRVDRSPLPYFKWLDKGYMGFYGVILLQEGFGRYFKTSREDQDLLVQLHEEHRKQKCANKQWLCYWGKRFEASDDLENQVQDAIQHDL